MLADRFIMDRNARSFLFLNVFMAAHVWDLAFHIIHHYNGPTCLHPLSIIYVSDIEQQIPAVNANILSYPRRRWYNHQLRLSPCPSVCLTLSVLNEKRQLSCRLNRNWKSAKLYVKMRE